MNIDSNILIILWFSILQLPLKLNLPFACRIIYERILC